MSLFSIDPSELNRESQWKPDADVYQTPAGWVVKFDLAGVRPQDLSVHFRESCLTVTGIRRDWLMEKGWNHHSLEISYNRFERTMELPCVLDTARVETEYREGMLLIFVTT